MGSLVNPLASVILLAGLSAAQAASAPRAADVPTLPVERMCREAAAADPTIEYGLKRCIDSEHEARDQLVQQWKNFPAGDKRECTAVATMGGTASYVELITCLEMNRDVREARAKAKVNSKPSSLSKEKPQ